MSQFDFPRINFHGRTVMDVGTANNGYYAPLEIWDPAMSKPVVPPAIQLTSDQVSELSGKIPPGSLDGPTNRVLILPVQSDEQFLAWVVTPLGQSDLDAAYHALYAAIHRTNQPDCPLTGAVPGYWNYYGDMSLAFENVRVSGVTTLASHGAPQTFTASDPADCPSDLAAILSASLTLENIPGNPSTNTGIMCDINAEGESVTQLFCDKLTLYSGSTTFFSGKPAKAVTRWIHIPQLVNAEPGPEYGAAAFYWAIPAEALTDADILDVFRDYLGRTVEVVGVLVRFALHRVFEVREPDYATIGDETNPALSEVTGTISPLCAGDMHSITLGRLLMPRGTPFKLDPPVGKAAPAQLGPMVARVDADRGLVSMDVLTSMLEIITEAPERGPTTRSSTPPVCEMADLGQFTLQAVASGSATTLASFGPEAYDESTFMARGGMIDLPLSAPLPADASLQLYSAMQTGLVLSETPVMLASDQNGLYTEEGDTSGQFMYDGLPKVRCGLRIVQNGSPLTDAEPFYVQQLVMTPEPPATGPYINTFYPLQRVPLYLRDGAVVEHIFPTSAPGCFVYVFIPLGWRLLDSVDEFLGNPGGYFYVTVRVLDAQDYGTYLDPSNPPSWDVVYDEVLRLYALIYPAMGKILPFTRQNWDNGTMAGMLANRIQESQWSSSLYMPRTRDLSAAQRRLLMAWAAQYGVKTPEPPAGPHPVSFRLKK